MTADDSTGPGAAAPGADPQVLALARAVDRTARKVTALDTHVRQLAADVARIATVVAARHDGPDGSHGDDETGEGAEPAPVMMRSWLLASDPEGAVADLVDLVEWLHRVFLRYHGAALSSCWLWHPDVVEELWWLRRAHAEAYHPTDGSWLRVGDWHDRQRPGVVRRVRDTVGSCELSLHVSGELHGRAPMVAPLAAHAAQVAAAWATGPGARPEPSAVQLDEAEAHNRALHRNHR